MTTLSASFSTTSWPGRSSASSTLGDTLTRILRPPVNTSAVSSSHAFRKTPKPGGRRPQPVHFLLERDDLVARLAQRRGQPLVLGGDAGETAFRLAQPLLQEPDLARGIRQPAPEHGDLLVEEGDLSGKALHLILMAGSTCALIPVGHGPHLLLSLLPRHYLLPAFPNPSTSYRRRIGS